MGGLEDEDGSLWVELARVLSTVGAVALLILGGMYYFSDARLQREFDDE